MSDDIHYDYATIETALNDINAQIDKTHALQDDVRKVFTDLTQVYEGDAATALHAKSTQIDNKMTEILADLKKSQTEAQDQADHMATLDAKLAANYQ